MSNDAFCGFQRKRQACLKDTSENTSFSFQNKVKQ